MIGFLRGYFYATGENVLTVVNNGIGYEVHSNALGAECPNHPAAPDDLWVHEHAPQDAPHELYGFREIKDRDLFRRLLNVQGVGPKVAMRLVHARAINADGVPVPATIRAVRGVGAKIEAAIMEEFS